MPQQCMENEYLAQVTLQEETEDYPSLDQGKLYPRPRRFPHAKVKTGIFYVLATLCTIFPFWMLFGGGIFYLAAITNDLIAFVTMFLVPCLGLVFLHHTDQKKP